MVRTRAGAGRRIPVVCPTRRGGTGLTGYTRNLDDGRVEVYAAGPEDRLSELAGKLHHGPRWADVRGVEEQEAAVEKHGSFLIG